MYQSIKDAPKRKCPECGKNGLRRLIGSGAGVIFKGTGFYETDYRSESYKAAAKADTEKKKPDSSEKSSSGDKAGTSSAGKKDSGTKASESD